MSSAPWSHEVENFLADVLKSNLVTLDELNVLCTDFLAESSALNREPTFEALCEFLISTGRLTVWQCERLKEGRWKGFFLDQYKLLNILETDEEFSYYLAEETSTKRRFKLKISPKSRIPPKDGKPYYEAQEL